MSQVTIFFIFSLIIGIFLVVIAFAFKKDKTDITYTYEGNANMVSDKLIKAVDDADDAIEQLTSMSANIFTEIEGKYQELLFLYQLIEDKRGEILDTVNKAPGKKTDEEPLKENEDEGRGLNMDPRFNEVFNRFDNGESVAVIAKDLGIGQGEVKFILEMGKKR